MAINVGAFTELDDFKRRTGDILRELRASKKTPGCQRIYTAGEKEYEAWVKTGREGIPLPKGVRDEMITMRNELGLLQYIFPWEKTK